MSKHAGKIIPVAIFDISSSSVAGAHTLISKAPDGKSNISFLASSRKFLEPKDDIDIERFVANNLSSLESVTATLQKADNHKPKEVFVLLSSPWFVSQTRNIVYNKNTSFVCTQKLIDSLIQKEIDFIVEHDMERFGSMGKDGKIIEKQISKITLNGYTTNNPFGKKTTSLEISILVTFSPKQIIQEFISKIQKAYGNPKISFATSPYATFIATRDFHEAPNELLIIDAGEETTDIAFIKNQIFLYQQSFPTGFYELYRKISDSNHGTLLETQALVETFRLGKLSAQLSSNLQKITEDFGEIWINKLKEAFQNNQSLKIPENIYVISLPPFTSFFVSYIKNSDFIKNFISGTKPNTAEVESALFSSHISSIDPEKIDNTLTVGALYASRII